MKRGLFISLLILLCFSGFAAQAAESTPADAAKDKAALQALSAGQVKALMPGNASEIFLEGFLDLKKEGPVTVLDVRSPASFAMRHIKGSVNLPLTELTEKTLPQAAPDRNAPVVLACDYTFAPTRMIAATIQAYPVLAASGYKKIYRLNLWNRRQGPAIPEEELEKTVGFEGTAVKPPATGK